ncbi:MAG: DNA polymerase III subunit beta [Gemmatimonadaceae bacterium]
MTTATASASAIFTLTKTTLLTGLTRAAGAISSKTTLPVLHNVLLTADESGTLRLVGTDLDVTVATLVDAAITGDHKGVTIPAKKLAEFVKECAEGPITLTVEGDAKSRLKAGAARMKLTGIPADKFPNVTERSAQAIDLFTLPAGTLAALAKPVAPCVSQEESRPILNGVLFEIGKATGSGDEAKRTVRMVATNGHRLGVSETTLIGDQAGASNGEAVDLILMPKVLALAASVYASDEAVTVAATPDKNAIVIKGATTTLTARLIEGPYPNYRQVLPDDFSVVVESDRAAIAQSVKRVNVIASDQTHRIALRVTSGADEARVTVSATTPDMGEAEDWTPVRIAEGAVEGKEGFRIGFNAAYLLDLLKLTPSDAVRLSLKAPERAARIEPAYGDEKPSVTSFHVLMPLRLMD